MFDKLKQLGELKKMRDQAMALKRQLAQERVEVNEGGVRVVITGDQEIEVLEAEGEALNKVREVINKAIKKSQEVAAKKLQAMTGGLSGLLGR